MVVHRDDARRTHRDQLDRAQFLRSGQQQFLPRLLPLASIIHAIFGHKKSPLVQEANYNAIGTLSELRYVSGEA